MLIGLAIWILATSFVTAILYALDKRAAIRNDRRIPEKTLLVCSAVGGWPGGLAASRLLRHKTQKVPYRIGFALCIVLNLAIIVTLIFVRS